MSLTSITKNNLKTIEPFQTFTGSHKKKKNMYKATGGIHHFMLMGFFNQKKTNKQTNKNHSVAAKEVLH